MPPKVILWDVMDTLVHDPFRDAMPAFFGLSLAELLELKHPNVWGRFERSEMAEADFLAAFFADGRSYDHEGFKACIRAAYRWVEGMEPLLAELLAAGVSMHTLSNYPQWYLWIEERLRLSRYVPWTFVSCRTALRKPDPAAYQHAARELALAPEQCLFIDDRAQNCEAARTVGMAALQFTGDAQGLRRALAAEGFALRASSG